MTIFVPVAATTMSSEEAFVLFTALLLGLASGANDGAALVAMAVPGRAPGPALALALLLLALVATPTVVGVRVASTLATGLVDFSTTAHAGGIAVAGVVSLALIAMLSRRGLPTSITLAFVGSLVGLGVGLGLTPDWRRVASVGAVGLIAPAAALIVGRLIATPLAGLGAGRWPNRRARLMATVAYAAQVFAYGANDGQRLAAVLLAGGLFDTASGTLGVPSLGAVAAAFGVGCLARIGSMYRRLGRTVLLARPEDATASQLASAAVVLSGATIGIPLSMTQSSTAALIGAGLARGHRRIRWPAAIDVAAAWLVTVPLSILAGMLVGLAWASVRSLSHADWR